MSERIEHPLLATVYDPVISLADRAYLWPHRAHLARGTTGRVLDLGAGTGAMFPHLWNVQDPAPSQAIHAIEPDPYMRRRAVERARTSGFPVSIVGGRAEALPYRANSFDTIISCLMFCTIADPARALDEVCRVLRRGGEFRVLEHVASTGWRGRVQRIVRPYWRRVAGGCEPDRRTLHRFLAHPGLSQVECEELDIGITPIRPFVRGRFEYVG